MKKKFPALIIIRGNSGSGKSTIAKKIREESKNPRQVAIVEQDYVRRVILKESDVENGKNIDLIEKIVSFALSHGYNVVLEGILTFSRYGKMLQKLIKACPNHHIYYLNVSFNETVKRHQTKPNCNEFGEKEMRAWYLANDITGFKNEIIIPESNSIEETVDQILNESRFVF